MAISDQGIPTVNDANITEIKEKIAIAIDVASKASAHPSAPLVLGALGLISIGGALYLKGGSKKEIL